ncbi:hypothetical protein PtA15_2A394 [Puccinia triticina]|uniref:Kinesin motor domain-containing protein n=1 Tax=Puccinia triticina TaxID=208348 RepID=A0ABY7CA81_9BASI|nr:uncharacterized protein PtA15_2A394 [Puccinia triticina]WAQ82081.1 hypothetical protein PtA15_2A394 [Puccinia triticina]
MQALQNILHRSREHSAGQPSEPPPKTLKPPMPAYALAAEASSDASSSSSSHNTLHAVKVVCRLRPRLPDESTADQSVVQVLNNTQIRITDPLKHLVNRFDFSACYDEKSGQHDIYAGQVQDMVNKIFEGITATIFTFGCTGSGKTHTLQGSASDPGITPRAVRTIFERVEALKTSAGSGTGSYQVSISCFEIWKDKVWDLLVQGGTATTRDVGRGDLPIREAANGQIFIPHLRHVTIKSIPQFEKLYAQVMRFRSVSSTKLNHTSSRSHAILSIHVDHLPPDGAPPTHLGKCVLIDLAGSENNKKTGNENNKERMKESVEINQSLLALRKVVRSLNTGDHRIPYRDSKLTRILSDSLGGTSAGLVICNIAPVASQYRDTINTLTFGSHSRNVENKVAHQALEALDRKFLLPSISLYQHHSKSVPSLSSTQPGTTEPIRSPIKLTWARRPSVDAFSKLPFPHTPSKPSSKTPSGNAGVGAVNSLSVRTRKLSGCFASPAKPASTPRKLSFRPAQPPGLPAHSPPAAASTPERALLLDADLDKRVEEAMRKNLDSIVQSRVDILLQAKLNETSLASARPLLDASTLCDSPGPAAGSPTTTLQGPHPPYHKPEDGDGLEERICHLEQQLQREHQQLTPVRLHLFPPEIRNQNPAPVGPVARRVPGPFFPAPGLVEAC